MRAIDLTGQPFGRWTVVRRIENTVASGTNWECRCECGTIKAVSGVALRGGLSRSCGCLKIETIVARSTKHGHSPMRGGFTSTYRTWAEMLRRCRNPNAQHYARYGGRGIAVCERWIDFRNFLADMGEKPTGRRISIDRIDNDGDYAPGNCRWATDSEQARNRSNNRRLTWRGETRLLVEWGALVGISPDVICRRLSEGASVEEALTKTVAVGRGLGKLRAQPVLGQSK